MLVRATPARVKCAVRCTVKVICRRARERTIEKTIEISTSSSVSASNHLPSSLYKLKISFQTFTSNYEKRRMCAECEHTLNKKESCHGKDGYLIQVPWRRP